MKQKYVPDLKRIGALYESNYQRLCKLINLMQGSEIARFGLHTGMQYLGDVEIKRLEVFTYTETVGLEQTASVGKWLNNPQMTVRLYHDARVAEVISCCRYQRVQPVNDYPNKFMHHPDEKDQINSFLADWLNFCLQHGICKPESLVKVRM